jgi:Skp family chaperone for outer membrane proteins
MRRTSLCVALVAGAIMAVGCGMQSGQPQASSSGGLAVVDLDVVAKSIGRTQEINELLRVRQNALNQELEKLQTKFNQEIAEKKKEHSNPPTDEEKALEAQWEKNKLALQLQAKQQATQALQAYRQEQLIAFRNEIKPLAQEVAAARGLSVVIPKNEGFLLSVDPGVDITADVIKAYSAKKPAPSTATVAPVKPQRQAALPDTGASETK